MKTILILALVYIAAAAPHEPFCNIVREKDFAVKSGGSICALCMPGTSTNPLYHWGRWNLTNPNRNSIYHLEAQKLTVRNDGSGLCTETVFGVFYFPQNGSYNDPEHFEYEGAGFGDTWCNNFCVYCDKTDGPCIFDFLSIDWYYQHF